MSPSDSLAPPQPYILPADHIIPLSPPIPPPFERYHSATSLPMTPRTPYIGENASSRPFDTPSNGLKPYLTLPTRLLLTTLTPALLPFILTIAHLISTRSSTATLAAQLGKSVLSACSGLATGAASLQTLPRYLAMQTNDEMVRATQASILAVGTALIDCVTIIETVVTFIVDCYRSMLLCTIELAVRGTLDILISAVQTISEAVTSSLNTIRTNIQDDIASANSLVQSAATGINKVTSLAGVDLTIPNISIPSLTALENVTVPTGFESTLLKLNSSLPTLSDLKAKMDSIIDTPFELLIAQINQSRIDIAASFNSSILPVPSLTSLSADDANSLNNQLCSGLDTALIDDTASALNKLSNVAIGLTFLLLFICWGVLCFWEWRKWKAMRDRVETLEEEWAREGKMDSWRVVAVVEHPILEKYGSRVLKRVTSSPKTRTNLRWYLAYLSHPTCLALLLISLLGLLSLEFQLVALNAIKDHAHATANSTVTASTDDLTAKLNAAAMNSSLAYAEEFNQALAGYQQRIDNELFGPWLNTTAVVLNQTLVEFYAGVEDALNATFGSTILYQPINTFIYCILGAKITNLEIGLTWISQHAQLTLPSMPNNTLLLSNATMNEMIAPITAAAVGSGSGDGGVVGELIQHFESALVFERNFYAILLGVWLGFALVGLLIMMWHSGGRERYQSWRGTRPATDNNGSATDGKKGFFWRWKEAPPHPIYESYTEKQAAVPRIVEPNANSFLDYQRGGNPPVRPVTARKATFGSTLSALAAPGQAFLRMGSSSKVTEGLIEKPGHTSETYNAGNDDDPPTPPPFWVNKFYGAFDNVKNLMPKNGGLRRNASTRTENSFGASQMPSAITPREDWQGRPDQWDMITPPQTNATDSRYPVLSRNYDPNPPTDRIYPRPMSRAPTLGTLDFTARSPPAVPNKHDSIDYLQDAEEEVYDPRETQMMSPASSNMSYFAAEAQVESANRVQTGTAALAAVFANLQRQKKENPFRTPMDDEHGERY
ncbi:hypothetical protein P7C73_g4789, partial [Tremellales sp. Uapishka_1]